MRLSLIPLAMLVLALALFGCEAPEDDKSDDPEGEPPPPTPEEIFAAALGQLGLRGGQSPDFVNRADFWQKVRSFKSTSSVTPEGREAQDMMTKRLNDEIKGAESAKNWGMCLVFVGGFEVMRPDSNRHGHLKELATAEMERPQVRVTGISEARGEATVFLNFYWPLTQVLKKERMRVGEEMHDLKLLEIVGDNKGVRMEYKTGTVYEFLQQVNR